MWQKGKYGLYISDKHTTIYWPDETGWHVAGFIHHIWWKNGGGWSVLNNNDSFRGAALVAPLSVLYWSNKE